MPVCIAGMHRSGTSLIARLLNLCGVFLGHEGELIASAADNPEGFWENRRFVSINDNLLARLSGRWDIPPLLSVGWPARPDLAEIRADARDLVQSFAGQKAWGWKDPRNSLTVAFWRELVPDLKVVVCLRNPLDVAASLTERNGFSRLFGLNLWLAYMQSLVVFAGLENCVITHYDAYFLDPQAELRRVVDQIGLPATTAMVKDACSSAIKPLRHSLSHAEDLEAAGLPHASQDVYRALEDRAGSVYASLSDVSLDRQTPPPALTEDAYNACAQEVRLQACVDRVSDFIGWMETSKMHVNQLYQQTQLFRDQLRQVSEQVNTLSATQNSNQQSIASISQVLQRLGSVTSSQAERLENLIQLLQAPGQPTSQG